MQARIIAVVDATLMRKEQNAEAVLFGDSLGKKEKHCKLYKMLMAEMANTMATQTQLMKPMLADERGFKYGPGVVRTGVATTTVKSVVPEATLDKTVMEIAGRAVVGTTKLEIDIETGTVVV